VFCTTLYAYRDGSKNGETWTKSGDKVINPSGNLVLGNKLNEEVRKELEKNHTTHTKVKNRLKHLVTSRSFCSFTYNHHTLHDVSNTGDF
jgi:hypothetical protein